MNGYKTLSSGPGPQPSMNRQASVYHYGWGLGLLGTPEPPEETKCPESALASLAHICSLQKKPMAVCSLPGYNPPAPSSIWKVLEDLCSSLAATPAIHHGAVSLTVD